MLGQRRVGRFPGVREDVPDEEDEHPDGHAVETGLKSRRRGAKPPEGKAEEDGKPGDRAQQGDLAGGHGDSRTIQH